MATKVLESSVSQDKDGSWRFQCPGIEGHVCGAQDSDVGFTSSGWPSKKVAQARGLQHFHEHKFPAAFDQAVADAVQKADGDASKVDIAAILEEVAAAHRTPSLEEFRAEHGLVAHPDDGNRAVRIEDLP